ncbi:hypothetical protein ACFPDQ_07790 [Pseudofrancisella aestuarii]|uniref:Uncharacterized protein n=2 Tax=Pseudofrancisella aestuarii TaxID=2670347 RepID=A0ABV9TDU6_9GAMM
MFSGNVKYRFKFVIAWSFLLLTALWPLPFLLIHGVRDFLVTLGSLLFVVIGGGGCGCFLTFLIWCMVFGVFGPFILLYGLIVMLAFLSLKEFYEENLP